MSRPRRAIRAVGLPAAVLPLVFGLSLSSPLSAHATSQPGPFQTMAGSLLEPAWVLPVRDYRLTGRFGDVSGLWHTVHTGLDFAAPYGTAIHAVAGGVVVSTAYDGSYGNKTVIRLPDGTTLWYCHQSAIAVHVGQRVEAGQFIGNIGTTGNVTGPHVHLEVHPHGGAPVDPYAVLRHHGLRP
jgi:murein DD-endopeptidase MepM/ murein hydrolase activator NlpD